MEDTITTRTPGDAGAVVPAVAPAVVVGDGLWASLLRVSLLRAFRCALSSCDARNQWDK